MSEGGTVLLLIAAVLFFSIGMKGMHDNRENYEKFCKSHNLEYQDWNTNAITCFDAKTNEVKAFKNDL